MAWMLAVVVAVATHPVDDVLRDRVDVIELNHYYNDRGQLIFDQIIFWDWCPTAGRLKVRAWRLVKSAWHLPERDWQRGGWSALWLDGDRLRAVYAGAFRETWTQYDPEIEDRRLYDVTQRRKLR